MVTSHVGGFEIDLKKNDFEEQHDILVRGSEIRGAPSKVVSWSSEPSTVVFSS